MFHKEAIAHTIQKFTAQIMEYGLIVRNLPKSVYDYGRYLKLLEDR